MVVMRRFATATALLLVLAAGPASGQRGVTDSPGTLDGSTFLWQSDPQAGSVGWTPGHNWQSTPVADGHNWQGAPWDGQTDERSYAARPGGSGTWG
jgi:hypothetical protein